MLVPSLLVVLALLTMLTVLGRMCYKCVIEKRKDSIFKEQSEQENVREGDNANEENKLASDGIYNHLNLRIRSSFVTPYNSRRELADEMYIQQVSSEPYLSTTCQKKKESTPDKDVNGYERYVEMDFGNDKPEETLYKHNVSNEMFYSNPRQRMQKCFSNSDVRASPRPTGRDTNTYNYNERQLLRSVVDTRPDRSVASNKVSDDLYFDVSYSLESKPRRIRRTKHNNSPYPPSPPTPGKRIDVNLSTEQIYEATKNRNSTRRISSNRKSLSCGDLRLKMEGQLFSTNARSESPVSSEISDELYFNTSHLDRSTRTSCDQVEVSQRSMCRNDNDEDDKTDYVNCGNFV